MRTLYSRLLLSIILIAGIVNVSSADPTITGRTTVPAYDFIDLTITGAGADDIIFWDLTEESKAHIKEVGNSFLFTGPPGEYHIRVKVIPVKDGKISGKPFSLRSTILIGDAPIPVPPGPVPVPPGPTPTPDLPAPIAGDGLRVLMIEDATQRTKLLASQINVLTGRTVRDYLNQKTQIGPDGKTHEWRIWDKDTDPTGDEKCWVDAIKRPRASVPWIIISNGKTGYEGPLPATPDEALNLLKKYAEAK